MQSTAIAEETESAASNDLGPLAWVLDELKKSLDGATKAMRRFVRDAELARGSDMANLDASQLRIARQQLHQAVGALEMVGFSAPAKVMRAMEALAQKFVQRPELCSDDAANKMEKASFALAEYLEGVLKGKSSSPVALFAQYRDVLDMVDGERVHPADLWPLDWQWVDAPMPVDAITLPYAPAVRSQLDQSVLRLVKTGDTASAAKLRDLSLGLAKAQTLLEARVFWKICAAFFEAHAQSLCPSDVYSKRGASRVLLQYATLAKGDPSVSDRLAQDLLFFCAQAVPASDASAPVLAAIRHAYKLTQTGTVNYAVAQFGRFDPAVLAQVRKRIASATESWSALAGGDTNRLKVVSDQFAAVCESILKLHPESSELARTMSRAIDLTVKSGEPPSTPVAMEVATAVLYLEAAYEDMDPADTTMATRSLRLAQRLENVSGGGQSEPLESWMEDLYRRVSDRQTMGSVVDELRTNLAEIEKSLDQFFRNADDKTPLHEVPSQLSQMRGVFSVLGLDQASTAMLRMRDIVEKLLIDNVIPGPNTSASFEKLGSSLGAVGFLIDMLSYQRAMAKKVFVWDDDTGEFKPLMGRVKPAAKVTPPSSVVVSAVPMPAPELAVDVVPASASVSAPVVAPVGVAAVAALGAGLVAAQVSSEPALPMAALATAPVTPVAPAAQDAPAFAPTPAPALEALSEDEMEIREIFLEEATEVVQTGQTALVALAKDPANLADQTTLRRAFHTLKGSSRMVGLNEFGEAAWSMEQLLNSWLAEQKPANASLVNLSGQAMTAFGQWVGHIAARTDANWSAVGFRRSADALRLEGAEVALAYPGAPQAAPPTPDVSPAIVIAPPEVLPEPVSEAEAAAFMESISPSILPAQESPTTEIFEPSRSPDTELQPDFESTEMFAAHGIPPLVSKDSKISGFAPLGLDDFNFGAEPTPPEFAATGFSEPPSSVLDGISLDLSPPPATPQPVAEISAPIDAADSRWDFGVSEQAPTPPDSVLPITAVSEPAPLAAEESVKVIGDLRISIPLYNVYLNEADEWSRRLQVELSEWALELHKPVPDSCVALAHSLSGSSATVGFDALSDIARHLEAGLQHVQSNGPGRPVHAQIFSSAAEEIRRLLHQFAAGFLKPADTEVLDALNSLPNLEFAASSQSVMGDLDFSSALAEPSLEDAPREFEAPVSVLPEAVDTQPDFAVSQSPDTRPQQRSGSESGATAFAALALPAAASLVVAAAPVVLDSSDDDIDLVDALDADLFPIFEEEAQELMPQLGGALRQWTARPDNLGARGEALRVLHTLKGSARLAGALRLGEMTHRMESAIEHLGVESLSTAQLDPLLTRFDDIQANFAALQSGPEQSFALPEGDTAGLAASVAAAALTGFVSGDASSAPAQQVPETAKLSVQRLAPTTTALAPIRQVANQSVRVRSLLLDRLVNQAGEVMITRSRLESRLDQLRVAMNDLTGNLERMRHHLRDIEVQAESQMQSRMALAKETSQQFDPLEFDQFTRLQELTRMMAESVNDVATIQRNMQTTVEGTEDDLIAQGRQARELQRDLLRTRMVEFEGISDRLYGVVRQSAKEAGKQVKLDITGGSLDVDRGVLERMAPAFEHLLRNSVAHGIETPEARQKAGKPAAGTIMIDLQHMSNELSVSFGDDGAGLDLARIRDKAVSSGVAADAHTLSDADAANLIFLPGFSTAATVTEMAGRGIGMDVVRSEMNALGGRIETTTERGKGTQFRLILPLTTAVTQVVMLRMGDLNIGVPANVIEIVRRVPAADLDAAYTSSHFTHAGTQMPFYWGGSLLQASSHSNEMITKNLPVVIFRSAGQRIAVHVDEILGNQEVVVKNLGPQLSRLPGLTGMSVLASGAVVLIYNPVALVTVYGEQARALRLTALTPSAGSTSTAAPGAAQDTTAGQAGAAMPSMMAGVTQVPLVMVVDDSITVRRVTQRLLKREGYRVVMAADGLQALERLQDEKPTVVLSDIEMPRMDGFDLARNIRADANLRDLPIIMITSRIAEKHREHARELGVDHYLGKPYSEEELLRLVKNYCDKAVPA